jgi:Bacteriophage head to tail connecting protein
MADPVETAAPAGSLAAMGLQKLAACRRWKSLWDLDLRECYFFAAPQRNRTIQSYSPPPQQRLLDAAELNTDLAMEMAGDFATEVINTYMPEAQNWCELAKGPGVPAEAWKDVKDQVQEITETVFDAIKASNFYAELSKAFDPDLAIGTVGMWIEPPGGRMDTAIVCSAIPMREFEIDLGPYGEIDTRFAVRHTYNHYLETLLGAEIWEKVSEEIKEAVRIKPSDRTQLVWGFWRKWDRHDDEVWQHVVYIKNDLIHDTELVGEGSCPFIIFRWNPNSDWPWGHGPLLQGLPTMRQVDELEIMRIDHAEMSIRPPLAYPDDSFAAIEAGLEPNMGYPVRVGSESAIKRIYEPPPPEAANYQYEEKEHRLRKMFYIDFPQQSGDTPPTLGQWLDEMARAQRRIGRPGLPFWREGPAKIFQRFKYIQTKRGKVQPVKSDGKLISLVPYNPAQRAAEQQEIAMSVQFLQLCGQFFPEEFKMWIDGKETMLALMDKMRVLLVKVRPEDQVAGAVDQMQKLLGGTPPGGVIKGSSPSAPGAPQIPQ